MDSTILQVPISKALRDEASIAASNTVTVTGKTSAGSTIIITSEDAEKVVPVDATGNFTSVVDLISGYNTITVFAYDSAGNESSQSLTVTYSTAKI